MLAFGIYQLNIYQQYKSFNNLIEIFFYFTDLDLKNVSVHSNIINYFDSFRTVQKDNKIHFSTIGSFIDRLTH